MLLCRSSEGTGQAFGAKQTSSDKFATPRIASVAPHAKCATEAPRRERHGRVPDRRALSHAAAGKLHRGFTFVRLVGTHFEIVRIFHGRGFKEKEIDEEIHASREARAYSKGSHA